MELNYKEAALWAPRRRKDGMQCCN